MSEALVATPSLSSLPVPWRDPHTVPQGELTSYISALDERVVCAAPSCYITSLERLFATLGPQDGNRWDYLALVYYPSVAAFIDMMTSADYETLSDPHRRNGCAEHVIIATAEAYSKFRIGDGLS